MSFEPKDHPLLAMSGWPGAVQLASFPKWEWIDDPLRGDMSVRFRRENYTQRCRTDMLGLRDLEASLTTGRLDTQVVTRRTMQGLIPMIESGSSKVLHNLRGGRLSLEAVEACLAEAWAKGGSPSTLVVNPIVLHDDDRCSLPAKHRDPEACKPPRDPWAQWSLDTDFGILDVAFSLYVPGDHALLADHMRLQLVRLPVHGNLDEFTLQARNTFDGGHALIRGIAH